MWLTVQDPPSLPATCQPVFSDETNNQLQPRVGAGEPVRVTLSLENSFNTPLQLRRVHLLWRFRHRTDTAMVAVQYTRNIEEGDTILILHQFHPTAVSDCSAARPIRRARW